MIFVWFFKFIFFCLKRFVAYLSELEVLLVLAVLLLVFLFLVYKEIKKDLKKIGDIRLTSKFSGLSGLWDFLSLIMPQLNIASSQSLAGSGFMLRVGRTERISLN